MPEKTFRARWWEKIPDSTKVKCNLCPRRCVIAEGRTGYCAVRQNIGGELASLAYGYPVALQIDPIEKKPLAHFMPGTRTFSIGTFGCNLGCVFCQNHHLSRGTYQPRTKYKFYSPEDMVELVLRHGCESIAFTYSEPTVFGEYAMDTAILAKKAGLATVLVSNAFITLEAAKDIYPLMDAANIDIKGFTEEFYHSMCKATLKDVLAATEYYKNVAHGHLELTNLVIPGKNDSPEQIDAYLDWVRDKLGDDTPLHFTAYHPDYIYSESPRTPIKLLEKIQEHALKRGFKHVHLGNIC